MDDILNLYTHTIDESKKENAELKEEFWNWKKQLAQEQKKITQMQVDIEPLKEEIVKRQSTLQQIQF